MATRASDTFELDASDVERMQRDLAKYASPKVRQRITKAGLRGYAQPIVAEVKKQITRTRSKKHGYLRKAIWGKPPKIFANGNFWVVVGAKPKGKFPLPRTRGSRPELYYHLVDGGTQPHYTFRGVSNKTARGQFFGRRLAGAGVTTNHPGFAGRKIRDEGFKKGVPRSSAKFWERFRKQDEREFRKATQSRSGLA